MKFPLIGLTTTHIRQTRVFEATIADYSCAILAAGGLPVLIPLSVLEAGDESILRDLYERLDGLLLPGGGDIAPEFYGEAPTDRVQNINRVRDQVEITLARWAFEDDLPTLGICRGHQLLNVALGGTMIRDIPAEVPLSRLHHDIEPHSTIAHQIVLRPNTQLQAILGVQEIGVNSVHHQAVRELAPSLYATAYAEDGILEAFEAPNARFYLGVQWHPEAIYQQVPAMKALFTTFIKACQTLKIQFPV